jgi:peroxin-2
MVGGTGVLDTLPERFCGICFSQGREGRLVTNPYVGECGHVYCYACLIGEVVGEEGDGWGCLRCGYVIRQIRRWEEKVEDEGDQKGGPTEDETVHEKTGTDENKDDEEDEEDEKVEVDAESPELESEEEVSGDENSEDSNEENLFSRG